MNEKNKRPGRPKGYRAPQPRTVRFPIRWTAEEILRIEQAAADRHMLPSRMIRKIVLAAIIPEPTA